MSFPRLLILVTLLGFYISGFTQDFQNVSRSNITQEINGVEYYLHEVKKGETLSAISRAYHVKLKDITDSNPGITENIKPGDFIKIPVEPANPASQETEEQGMNYRRVAKGETLYSLSKEYNVSVDEIKAANNGLPDGLKTGSFIKIPVRQRSSKTESSSQQTTNKDWFEYQAKDREIIYELAIRYRVSVDSIYGLNPGIDEKLSAGQIIRIPLVTQSKTFITHTVKQRQTMNRLARKYDLDIELIKEINPYISRHLQIGQVLRIPLPELKKDDEDTNLITEKDREMMEETREKSQREICHNKYELGEYDVALILPFFLSVYDSIQQIEPEETENVDPAFIKPYVFIQFYEGFMLALDSLEKIGLNVKLHVYNLEDDIQQAKVLIKNPDLKNMDLIIGPVYGNTFKVVADFAREHQIKIVNPLSTREETTYGNPYVYQPQPTNLDQNQKLLEFLNKEHDFSQIFIARHNEYRDELALNELKSVLNKDLESRLPVFTSLYHEIVYSKDSTYTFEHLASVDYQNVVIVYSENKVFILDILRSLNELRDTFNIMVVGMPEWNKIEGLEAEHLNNLNTHIFARNFTNYNQQTVRRFVAQFRDTYATEPNDFAFSGYNIGMYFMSALMKYGPDFADCIRYYDMELLNMGIDFNRLEPGSGFRNINWKILEMYDYELNDVSTRLKTYDLSKPPEEYFRYMDLEED